ncbi:hypothetical protein B0T14DRAFT_122487 [Immersiella caudata]|uniref:Uncharacterized protein n=1 Tax=Immersiella caudata TaxID=314043 RepID=A0AA39X423_9PEZI|nr:hypothetical protein B0T14DRAFT_122487 [Immersiella caudata]
MSRALGQCEHEGESLWSVTGLVISFPRTRRGKIPETIGLEKFSSSPAAFHGSRISHMYNTLLRHVRCMSQVAGCKPLWLALLRGRYCEAGYSPAGAFFLSPGSSDGLICPAIGQASWQLVPKGRCQSAPRGWLSFVSSRTRSKDIPVIMALFKMNAMT